MMQSTVILNRIATLFFRIFFFPNNFLYYSNWLLQMCLVFLIDRLARKLDPMQMETKLLKEIHKHALRVIRSF